MRDALRESGGKVVYVCNTTTQPGQTDGYRAVDHVRRLIEIVGPGVIDAALINGGVPEADTLRRYESAGLLLIRPDAAELAEIAELGIRPIVRDLAERGGEQRALWNKLDTIRHDPHALGATLLELLAK
jgi:2-phospho-L-lactate transferase/gluconeogenesis factor (CofD/UPF0052 family)